MTGGSPSPSAQIVHHLPQAAIEAPFRLFFGGSFDPPHIGHACLPPRVLREMDQPDAWLVYVPAARSPHKDKPPVDDHHRVRMLGIALGGIDRCVIWDTELARAHNRPDEPSYWADTWDLANHTVPGGVNRFLIGADQARSMHRWHRFESIWADAIVLLRGEHDDPDQLCDALEHCGAWNQQQIMHWRSSIMRVPTVDASSTHIRAMLNDPKTRKNPIAGLDDRVHEYILEHGLYAS